MGHDFPPTLLARLALRIAEHCRASLPAPPVAPVAPSPDVMPPGPID
jgi:hypothetical protein